MLLRILVPALATAALLAPAAHAAPARCEGAGAQRTLVSGGGMLESVWVDPAGVIFYSDLDAGKLMRLDAPGQQPRLLAEIPDPGGIAQLPDGRLIVGSGNTLLGGALGNLAGRASLFLVDPVTGAKTTFATGLGMANGIVRDPHDGTIYASNDLGTGIDRISADGKRVERNWASVVSPNGLALDAAGRSLFAAQTFQPAAIRRVDLARPSTTEQWAAPGLADIASGPDGMTSDEKDRLYVAANTGNAVWRVDKDRSICTVASGGALVNPSAVALRGRSAIAVTFSGNVVEIADARPDAPATTATSPAPATPADPACSLTGSVLLRRSLVYVGVLCKRTLTFDLRLGFVVSKDRARIVRTGIRARRGAPRQVAVRIPKSLATRLRRRPEPPLLHVELVSRGRLLSGVSARMKRR